MDPSWAMKCPYVLSHQISVKSRHSNHFKPIESPLKPPIHFHEIRTSGVGQMAIEIVDVPIKNGDFP
jgi:hypothetical protein